MKHWKLFGVLLLLTTGYGEFARAQQPQAQAPAQAQTKIPAGSKVFVAPMGGFETPLRKAIADKKVPIEIVEQREQAEYEITGTSESRKASTAKKVIPGELAFRRRGQHQSGKRKDGRNGLCLCRAQTGLGARTAEYGRGVRKAFKG
jgi:hypothetical protein